MLEELNKLKQEKEVLENLVKLRRKRYEEQMEELKAEYANKISEKTGRLIMSDVTIKELDKQFENRISQEFGEKIKIINKKIDLKTEILNKENEIAEKNKLVIEKRGQIEQAEDVINHEIIRQYFSKEGLLEQSIDKSHIEVMNRELEELLKDLDVLEKERENLYNKLEELEPSNKQKNEVIDNKTSEDISNDNDTKKDVGNKVNVNNTLNVKEIYVDNNSMNLKNILININKYGCSLKREIENGFINTCKDEISPFTNLQGINVKKEELKYGDKWVIRELINARNKEILTQQDMVEQLYLYKEILVTKDENKIDELRKKLKLTINYDLNGMRKSELTKKERKDLEINAKRVKELKIGYVEVPWYIEVKWKIQDFVKQHGFDKFKNKIQTISTNDIELLPAKKEKESEIVLDNNKEEYHKDIKHKDIKHKDIKTDRFGNRIEKNDKEEELDEVKKHMRKVLDNIKINSEKTK